MLAFHPFYLYQFACFHRNFVYQYNWPDKHHHPLPAGMLPSLCSVMCSGLCSCSLHQGHYHQFYGYLAANFSLSTDMSFLVIIVMHGHLVQLILTAELQLYLRYGSLFWYTKAKCIYHHMHEGMDNQFLLGTMQIEDMSTKDKRSKWLC